MVLTLICFLIALFLIIFFITVWVTKPLKRLNAVMDEAGQGNLSVQADVLYHDEIGQVTVTFNNMLKQLAELMEKTAKTTQLELQFQAEMQQRQLAETLRRTTHSISSTLDLHEVLERVLKNLQELLPFDRASIWIKEKDRDKLVMKARRLGPMRVRGVGEVPKSYFDPQLYFKDLMDTSAPVLKVSPEGWQLLAVPLFFNHAVSGMLVIETESYRYNEREIGLAFTYSGQAGIAIENARIYSRMQDMAVTDELTGVCNRRHFFQLAEQECKRSTRYGMALSVMMFDIDHFKQVNDQYGHLVGDEVIKKVAHCVREALRETDILARYGGEEFAVLLPETGRVEALMTAERLRQAIAQLIFPVNGGTFQITCSFGVTDFRPESDTIGIMLNRSDNALYDAKRGGRNKVIAG